MEPWRRRREEMEDGDPAVAGRRLEDREFKLKSEELKTEG